MKKKKEKKVSLFFCQGEESNHLEKTQSIPYSMHKEEVGTGTPLGFPGGSFGEEYACNAGDLGLIPGLGRSPRESIGYPLQYSGLENSMDYIVHGVTESQTRLSEDSKKSVCNTRDWVQSLGPKGPLEKGMTIHSSIIAWKAP